MTKWDAGSIAVNEVEVPVEVDDVSGQWVAEYAGHRLATDTREQLKGRLDRLTKKTKVIVEINVIKVMDPEGWTGGSVRVTRGVLTGLHAGTGNVLAAWTVRGKIQREQISGASWSDRTLYVGGDTSDEAVAEYNRLTQELNEVRKARDTWIKRHKIDPKDSVQRAIDAVSSKDEG